MAILPLPLSLYQADKYALSPALALLPKRMDTPEARVMCHAICLQESRYAYRRQIKGPARGFGQFEQGGGVAGVLRHPASAELARKVCAARNVKADAKAVYDALDKDDVLALAFVRLLLWTDSSPLPPIDHAPAAWSLYVRVWRPGKPHRQTWEPLHQEARAFVEGK